MTHTTNFIKWRVLLLLMIAMLSFVACNSGKAEKEPPLKKDPRLQMGISLVVLGTLQDGGIPHMGCEKDCCRPYYFAPDPNKKVVSLGLVDHKSQEAFLFEATPDISAQWKTLKEHLPEYSINAPKGIFLTHAHIGHYSGLLFLGKEAWNSKGVPVYAMPRMKTYLETNGPWDQLVGDSNISLVQLQAEEALSLNSEIGVVPFLVPHRDEYSETVGYKIIGPNKSALFIPDIDKWEKWEKSIVEAIAEVDYAFLDATFFDAAEINNRDISEIPHPFVVESFELFSALPGDEKAKVHFIHFNHTNPLVNSNGEAYKMVLEKGFQIARINQTFEL